MSELRKISDDVRRIGRVPQVDPLVAQARGVWAAAVGDDVARRSLPVRRAGDALVVHCASAAWASELTLLERQLRGRLATALGGEAPPLRFEVGNVDAPDPSAGRRAPAPSRAPSAEQLMQARELASSIADPDLREAAERAIAAALSRDS
ncbi:MAG TPA: DUF721 domain-containing protein [Gaiellales bacterium]